MRLIRLVTAEEVVCELGNEGVGLGRVVDAVDASDGLLGVHAADSSGPCATPGGPPTYAATPRSNRKRYQSLAMLGRAAHEITDDPNSTSFPRR